ncbi:MAG: EAL domain-containing protein [Sphingopyxis sp.]|nr:EAL domain-containing protein [Sphingopyxis sp.]
MSARYPSIRPARSPLDGRRPSSFLDSEILHGIGHGQFRLVYQPKYSTRRGGIDGAEALVRWEHPDDGLMLPDRFIGKCEESGTIAELTLWTFEQAIADQREMRRDGHDMRLFVNLSAQLLTDEVMVASLCDRAAAPGVNLGVEVTERSVIADPNLAFANIRRLREAGLCIAIEYYCYGFSSL